LKTLDRISKWMNVQNMMCHLCNQDMESQSHLFFACPYAKRLWEKLNPMAKLEGIYGWLTYCGAFVCCGEISSLSALCILWSISCVVDVLVDVWLLLLKSLHGLSDDLEYTCLL
nr:RNA-directed DNA polymerase, eukaryota, reverse transcriptase zinc-binding domain protein [Tanacetum cinerariifolium]